MTVLLFPFRRQGEMNEVRTVAPIQSRCENIDE